MSEPHSLGRRQFVQAVSVALGGIMSAMIGLPMVGYLISPVLKKQTADAWVALGPVEGFEEGVPKLVTFTRTKINGWEKTVNSHGVYVVRKGGDFNVFSNVCTHLSCRVSWKDDQNGYFCPCHDALFTIDGGISRGPQPRPLDYFAADAKEVREDGILYINFSKVSKHDE